MGRLENILSAGFSVILAIVLLVHFVPDAEPEQSQKDHKAPMMPRASIVKIPMKTVEPVSYTHLTLPTIYSV